MKARSTRSLALFVLLAVFWAAATGVLLAGCPGLRAGVEPRVTLYNHRTGQRQRLGLEKYVEGVVAAEVDPRWPQAALEAQAILARTFTLGRIGSGGTRSLHRTDVCTDPRHFQAYAAERVTAQVRQAVKATRGQVMMYGTRFAGAWFHSASGGRTSTPREGLGLTRPTVPNLVPVRDATIPQNIAPWTATFTRAEVEKAAGKQGVKLGQMGPVSVSRKGPSGRALELTMAGKRVSAVSLRTALGSTRMRSTLLDEVKVDGDQLVMRGRGYGHGVGMSQWGAYAMARQGKTSTDIIRHYYQGVRLERRWA